MAVTHSTEPRNPKRAYVLTPEYDSILVACCFSFLNAGNIESGI